MARTKKSDSDSAAAAVLAEKPKRRSRAKVSHADADAAVVPDAPVDSADPVAGDQDDGLVPASVNVDVDLDLVARRPQDGVTIPEGVESSWGPNEQVHEYRGQTLTLDKITMSKAERLVAIERFEQYVDVELDG